MKNFQLLAASNQQLEEKPTSNSKYYFAPEKVSLPQARMKREAGVSPALSP